MLSKQSRENLGASIFVALLATIGVVLRVSARWRKKLSLIASDYTIILALVTVYGLTAVTVYAVVVDAYGAVLLDSAAIPADVLSKMTQRSKLLYADPILFYIAFYLVKISVLLFCKQIFVVRWFKIAAYALITLTTMWFIAAEATHIFADDPIEVWWEDPVSIESQRYNYFDLVLAQSIIDVILDLMIWCLPLILVRQLRISKARKISVAIIFSLGMFCIVTSVIRLYYVHLYRGIGRGEYPNNTRASAEFSADTFFKNSIWARVEAGVAVFTACLPTFGPFFAGRHMPESLVWLKVSIASLVRSSKSNSTNPGTIERKSARDDLRGMYPQVRRDEEWGRPTYTIGNSSKGSNSV